MSETIRRLEEMIKPEWIEKYKACIDVLWKELVSLQNYLFTLQKMESFRIDLFLPAPSDMNWWRTVRNALFEALIVGLWRLTRDTDKRSLTIPKMKDAILENTLDAESKQIAESTIRSANFAELSSKINIARNKYIAHLDSESNTNLDPARIEGEKITSGELDELLQSLKTLFDVLCFEAKRSLWIWDYNEDARKRGQTDVDHLFDSIVRNSLVLNMPENDPLWREYYQDLSSADLDLINRYRIKFNLQPISLI